MHVVYLEAENTHEKYMNTYLNVDVKNLNKNVLQRSMKMKRIF